MSEGRPSQGDCREEERSRPNFGGRGEVGKAPTPCLFHLRIVFLGC